MIYTKDSLIETYIQIHGIEQPHKDFLDYFKELLKNLGTLFEINLELEGIKSKQYKALWFLFRSTARAYGRVLQPLDGALDESLTIKQMYQSDAQGSSVEKYLKLTFETKKAHQESCRQLLEELFTVLWGTLEQKFTSEDLKLIGFDDSKEPKIEDYWDEI